MSPPALHLLRLLSVNDIVYADLRRVFCTRDAAELLRSGATDPSVHGAMPVEVQRFYVDQNFEGSVVPAPLDLTRLSGHQANSA